MSYDKKQGWCESVEALNNANMKGQMQTLEVQDLETDFLLMEFDIVAELTERGYLNSDGDIILLNSTRKRKGRLTTTN